ncbi:MAG: DNA repair protein RadA, partial [Sulfurimonadaceae bacterium]|nr:DNA repair protein RadA [Sulfurimonadaceae bacterium]
MAKKKKSMFECQHCGLTSPKWMGKCTNCGSWDSMVELSEQQQEIIKLTSSSPGGGSAKAQRISEVNEESVERFTSNDVELDLVLGGGVVPGSLTLIGGSPGVGKSTLLLKVGANIASTGKNVLYVTGEESEGQVKLRANRLDAIEESLYLISEIRLEQVLLEIEQRDYEFIIIDSIQTLYSENITSAPGSVTQVRQITFELMRIAKERQIAIFIIGHITKEGSIAGPRVLEHMVDTVLYFEGDSSQELRILRGFKNRFGPTSEIGVFEMRGEGLVSAKDISSRFFNRNKAQPGSALTVAMEGSRPIILEVQALVSDTHAPNPKRQATGFDNNRLNMLLALLERKLEIPLNSYDVFINIAGGIKINETSADLAILAAIISSFRNRVISKETVFIGEVSLVGDVREVFQLD